VGVIPDVGRPDGRATLTLCLLRNGLLNIALVFFAVFYVSERRGHACTLVIS
jgi:hypothetical protein